MSASSKVSPEFNAACAEYFTLKRIGLGRTPLALSARARMVDNAPDGVVDLLLQKAQHAGLLPADMPIRLVDPQGVQATAAAAINKAAGKGGAA